MPFDLSIKENLANDTGRVSRWIRLLRLFIAICTGIYYAIAQTDRVVEYQWPGSMPILCRDLVGQKPNDNQRNGSGRSHPSKALGKACGAITYDAIKILKIPCTSSHVTPKALVGLPCKAEIFDVSGVSLRKEPVLTVSCSSSSKLFLFSGVIDLVCLIGYTILSPAEPLCLYAATFKSLP